jgi:hypothetical protein
MFFPPPLPRRHSFSFGVINHNQRKVSEFNRDSAGGGVISHSEYEFYITLVFGLGLVKRAEGAHLLSYFTAKLPWKQILRSLQSKFIWVVPRRVSSLCVFFAAQIAKRIIR